MCQRIEPIPQLRRWTPKIVRLHRKCATVLVRGRRNHALLGDQPFLFQRHPGLGDCNWTDSDSAPRHHGHKGSSDIQGWHHPVYLDELDKTGQAASLRSLPRGRTTFEPNPTAQAQPPRSRPRSEQPSLLHLGPTLRIAAAVGEHPRQRCVGPLRPAPDLPQQQRHSESVE